MVPPVTQRTRIRTRCEQAASVALEPAGFKQMQEGVYWIGLCFRLRPMTSRMLPLRWAFALGAAGTLTLATSSSFADDELPNARPAPPPVEEPPPNTSPPQVAAKEGSGGGGEQADNALFVEVGGPALLYSLNYDRRIGDYFSFRVGGSYLGIGIAGVRAEAVIFPLSLNLLIGGRSWSHLELGGGAAPWFGSFGTKNDQPIAGVIGIVTVGYRLQAPTSAFFFRANINMLFERDFAVPWPGLSFGASF